jgi:hypothetical protein
MASATAKKRKASDSNGSGARSKDKRIEITKTLNIPSRRNLRRYFSFMDLLQEIKDMVYNEVWNDSNSMVFTPKSLQPQNSSQSPCRVVLRYGESLQDHISPGLPEWVMTNRAFYEKGLKQLLARAKFSRRHAADSNPSPCPGSTFRRSRNSTSISQMTKGLVSGASSPPPARPATPFESCCTKSSPT